MKTFKEAWAETGYQYGRDALENVELALPYGDTDMEESLTCSRCRVSDLGFGEDRLTY